jgi:hypothetical protein
MARSELRAGDILNKGDHLQSPDGRTKFTFQADGNILLSLNGFYVWDTATQNTNASSLHLQDDGVIIIKTDDGTVVKRIEDVGRGSSARLTCDNDNVLRLTTSQPSPFPDTVQTFGQPNLPTISKQRVVELKIALGLDPSMDDEHALDTAIFNYSQKKEMVYDDLEDERDQAQAKLEECMELLERIDEEEAAVPAENQAMLDYVAAQEKAMATQKNLTDVLWARDKYGDDVQELKKELEKWPAGE